MPVHPLNLDVLKISDQADREDLRNDHLCIFLQAIREEKEKEQKQLVSATNVLKLSLAERTAVQKLWNQLAHAYITESDLRQTAGIQLNSVDRFLAAALKDWSCGLMDRARRSHVIAQDTRQRALDLCESIAWPTARETLLMTDADRQELLSNLDAYISSYIPTSLDSVSDEIQMANSSSRRGSLELDEATHSFTGSVLFSPSRQAPQRSVDEQVNVFNALCVLTALAVNLAHFSYSFHHPALKIASLTECAAD